MIAGQGALNWLAHRAGEIKLNKNPFAIETRAFELNTKNEDFEATFAKREFRGFIGFVDLDGFSERVKGRNPKEVSEYVRPFLEGLTSAVTRQGWGFVDKTIGDEVMFMVPEAQSPNDPAILMVANVLARIMEVRATLGDDYPMRLGLSYGELYVDRVGCQEFSELTVFGEAVHLAKRLCDRELLKERPQALGMFGVLHRDPIAVERFAGILAWVGNRLSHEIVPSLPKGLKGVSEARCAYLFPKPEAEWPKCEIVRDQE